MRLLLQDFCVGNETADGLVKKRTTTRDTNERQPNNLQRPHPNTTTTLFICHGPQQSTQVDGQKG